MMKKILAAAIVSAFAAPAFAATANVDVYGTLNMSVDRVDGGGTTESRTRVASNNSNFGFKGTEDLGGGLSAVWQFEQAYGMDTGGSADVSNTDSVGTVGQRNTFMGLSSKAMGTLTLGNQESPMKTSIGKLDLFGNTIADYRTLMGPQVRGASSVLYTSPKMSGFDAKLMYSARNEAGNGATANPSYYSANVSYENGPLFAAVAVEEEELTATTGNDTTRLGVGYSFGAAKVGLGYNKTKADTGATTNAKSATWMLNAAYNMGATTLKAQYLSASDTKGTDGAANTGAKQFAVGADYALSKRTTMYALYTKLTNDSSSSRKLGSNSGVLGANTGVATVTPGAAGNDPTAFSIGMVHKF